jgi:hypothetical protein
MTTLCTAIKATGVTIFTVQIDTDGAGRAASMRQQTVEFLHADAAEPDRAGLLLDRHANLQAQGLKIARRDIGGRNIGNKKARLRQPGF